MNNTDVTYWAAHDSMSLLYNKSYVTNMLYTDRVIDEIISNVSSERRTELLYTRRGKPGQHRLVFFGLTEKLCPFIWIGFDDQKDGIVGKLVCKFGFVKIKILPHAS